MVIKVKVILRSRSFRNQDCLQNQIVSVQVAIAKRVAGIQLKDILISVNNGGHSKTSQSGFLESRDY